MEPTAISSRSRHNTPWWTLSDAGARSRCRRRPRRTVVRRAHTFPRGSTEAWSRLPARTPSCARRVGPSSDSKARFTLPRPPRARTRGARAATHTSASPCSTGPSSTPAERSTFSALLSCAFAVSETITSCQGCRDKTGDDDQELHLRSPSLLAVPRGVSRGGWWYWRVGGCCVRSRSRRRSRPGQQML